MLSSISMARRRMKGKRNTSKNGPTSAAVGNQFNSRLIVANLFSFNIILILQRDERELIKRVNYLGKFVESNWNLVIFVQNDQLVEDVGAIK